MSKLYGGDPDASFQMVLDVWHAVFLNKLRRFLPSDEDVERVIRRSRDKDVLLNRSGFATALQ